MSKKKIDDIDNNLDTENKIKKSSKQKDEKQEKKRFEVDTGSMVL